MKNPYLVAVLAGLAAAALQATLLTPSPVGIVLFSLSSLPLFVVGFAFGPQPVGLAGTVGAVVLAALLGWQMGFVFAVSAAIAPVILTWMALKHRTAAGVVPMEGEASDGNVQWYPEGRLILWAAGIGVVVMLASFLAGGGDLAALRAATAGVARRIGQMLARNNDVAKTDIDAFVRVMVVLVPPAATIIWHLATMICLWLAARIVAASGIGLRPWAPFSALRFPHQSLWVLAGAAALVGADIVWGPVATSTGAWGLIAFTGSLVLGAMTSSFLLLGLAVAHGLTAGLNGQFFVLGALYLALILLQGVLFLPLVVLAIVDMIFDLRGRMKGAAPPGVT